MYARLISFSGADPEKRESAIEMIRGTVIPMLQTYDGFAGYIALYDEEIATRRRSSSGRARTPRKPRRKRSKSGAGKWSTRLA